MKLLLVILFTLLPVMAQQKQKEPEWDKENDDYAIAYFRAAEQGRSYAGFLYQEFNEKDTCPLAVGYENMDWVVERAAKRVATLGKVGITPDSAKALRTKFGSALAQNLYSRVKKNKPLESPCMFHIGGAGPIVGSAIFDLGTIYQVVEHLEFILDQEPTLVKSISLAELLEPWKKSVVSVAPKLWERCKDDLESYTTEELQKYAGECKTLGRALTEGVSPASLKLNAATAAKLRSLSDK